MIALTALSLVPYTRGDSECGVGYSVVLSARYDGEHDCRRGEVRRSSIGIAALLVVITAPAFSFTQAAAVLVLVGDDRRAGLLHTMRHFGCARRG